MERFQQRKHMKLLLRGRGRFCTSQWSMKLWMVMFSVNYWLDFGMVKTTCYLKLWNIPKQGHATKLNEPHMVFRITLLYIWLFIWFRVIFFIWYNVDANPMLCLFVTLDVLTYGLKQTMSSLNNLSSKYYVYKRSCNQPNQMGLSWIHMNSAQGSET